MRIIELVVRQVPELRRALQAARLQDSLGALTWASILSLYVAGCVIGVPLLGASLLPLLSSSQELGVTYDLSCSTDATSLLIAYEAGVQQFTFACQQLMPRECGWALGRSGSGCSCS